MAALAVVPDLDPLEDGRPRRGAGRPGPGVDELGLEGGEEALGHGVVEAVARPAHRAVDAAGGERLPDRPRRCTGSRGRCGARGPAAAGGARRAIASASSASSVRRWSAIAQPTTRREWASSSTARYSQPSCVGDVRDVAEPEAVGRRGREVARDEVRRGRVRRVGDRGARAPPPVAADEARRAHQPRHALAGAAHARRPQLGVDARRAVGPAAARMDGGDLRRSAPRRPGRGPRPRGAPRRSRPSGRRRSTRQRTAIG